MNNGMNRGTVDWLRGLAKVFSDRGAIFVNERKALDQIAVDVEALEAEVAALRRELEAARPTDENRPVGPNAGRKP
jgi:hypothetical protein